MTPSPQAAALAHLEAGRLPEAEQAWRGILARSPGDVEALHMLGYVLTLTGRMGEGMQLIDRSIEREPRNAAMRCNRAGFLMDLGRDEEAMRDLRRALDLDPRLALALKMLGDIHFGRGRLDEASVAYRRALAIAPRMADAHVGMGIVHVRRGQAEAAGASFTAALSIDPGHAAAHYNLGVVLEEGGDLALAETSYRRALERDPGHVAALNNLGIVCRATDREPEARECFERALQRAPAHPDVLNNIGVSLQRAGLLDEALARFAQAVAMRPGFARALVNRGNALQDQGRLDEAQAAYEEAGRAQPGFAEARYGLSQVALRRQRFAEGWSLYEARFETSPPFTPARSYAIPRLTADGLQPGRRVAIWSEQGLGDQLLFSTLLPEIEARGVAAVVECDPRLIAAFRRRFPAFTFVEPAASDAAFAGCDAHVPAGSLPALLRPTVESFAAQPGALLTADPAREAVAREEMGAGRWIGIAWRSFQAGDRRALAERKSIPLECFAPLAQFPGTRLLDLQHGDVAAERAAFEERHPGSLARLGGLDAFTDLEGVMGALAACERVVTSSNALAHLAGALGRPTWLVYLGAREPFHYWVPGPDGRSLWYPSVEIVTDASWTRWEQAFEALAGRLQSA